MLQVSVTVPPSLAAKIAALKRASVVAPSLIRTQVRTSALSITARAKNLVPVSTGALRRSIIPTFFEGGFSALIGSFLPYAARQEFDPTLDHGVRPPRRRVINTKSGAPGSIIKGTQQTNPKATWGFMRKALAAEKVEFIRGLNNIVKMFSDGWRSA